MLYSRCCGIDIRQKTAVACTLLTQADGSVVRTVCTFSTMTQGLLALSDWLDEQHITHVCHGENRGAVASRLQCARG